MNNLKEAKEWLSQLVEARDHLKEEMDLCKKVRDYGGKYKATVAHHAIVCAIIETSIYFHVHYISSGGTYASYTKIGKEVEVTEYDYGVFFTTVRKTKLKY